MTDILRLDHLSLPDLNNLVNAVVGLKEAGYLMQDQGFEPTFSLVPGFPLQMRLDYRMPLPGPMGAVVPPRQAQHSDDDVQVHMFGSAPRPGPTAVQIEAAVNAACNKILPKLPTHAAEQARGSAKVEPVLPQPAPQPAPDPVAEPALHDPASAKPASAEPTSAEPTSAEPTSARPAPWTDDEDAKLVNEVAKRMALDQMGKGAAIAEVAAILGRPVDGSTYRLHTKLKSALQAAIEGLMGLAPEPAADPAPMADPAPVPDPVPKPNAGAMPAPQPPLTAATLSPIEEHLLAMPTKGGWTLETDLDLLELSQNGWTIPKIAAEFGRDGRAVTELFDLLTGYDRETKTRKWTRAALLIAAREWAAKRAPATAAE